MRYLNPSVAMSNKIVNWNYYNGDDDWREPEKGLTVIFDWFGEQSKRDALKKIKEILNYNEVSWLFEVDKKWFINIDALKLQFNEFSDLEWFRGEISIIPEYEDFLATEINYAIAEKRNIKEKFSIITLIFSNNEGKKGVVPELLKQYVWKEPKTDLEALREIIKVLPIQVGKTIWIN